MRGNPLGRTDAPNLALNVLNTCLYGVVEAAVNATGMSPALGCIHHGSRLSFVLDIADLYKTPIAVPLAFELVASHGSDAEPGPGHDDHTRIGRTGLQLPAPTTGSIRSESLWDPRRKRMNSRKRRINPVLMSLALAVGLAGCAGSGTEEASEIPAADQVQESVESTAVVLNPNLAGEEELLVLSHLDEAMVAAILERRPFLTMTACPVLLS